MTKKVDQNDFWFIEKNPITKVGVYPYLGKQISQDCEPNKIYYVLRPKEELFRKETLDSLRLIPLIDGHTMIGKDFTAPEDKGMDGIMGDNVSHDTDTIYNDLKIISNKMKDEIQNGKKELSLGYFCRYDKQPGTYKGQRYDFVQRDIIANHLALVDKGRMGADVRVYDSKNIPEGEAFAMDSIAVDFNDNHDEKGRFAKKNQENSKEEEIYKEMSFYKKELKAMKNLTSEGKFLHYRVLSPEDQLKVLKKLENYPNGYPSEEDMVKIDDFIYELFQQSKTKDMAFDDEDIEWITVKGTHIPIKKGENKEQAVKKFLELKRNGNGKVLEGKELEEFAHSKGAITEREREEKQFKSMPEKPGDKEFMEKADKYMKEHKLGKYSKQQSSGEKEQKKEIPSSFEKGDIMYSKKLDKNYAYLGKNKDGLYMFADNDKFIKNDITDDDIWLVSEKYLKNNLADGNMTLAENRSGYEKSEPEGKGTKTTTEKGKNYDAIRKISKYANKNFTLLGKEKEGFNEFLNEVYYENLNDEDMTGNISDITWKAIKEFREYNEELEKSGQKKFGEDSMEYKTIQGEGKMADKKEKVAIDEDKRKLIDEIGGILKDEGLDDELIRTVIGKAEKLAYNKSEAGDEGEEVEEEVVNEEEVEEEGKEKEVKDKKAAKDKCGKDEEEAEEEDKEEEKKKEMVKTFAKKEKLAKEVEDALGTFDHSEMTELEIAKYACDKLDLEVEKGQEVSAVKGYLKGLAKAPKATFGYKTVAADSSIQTEDAEFEKFTKGE